MKSKVEITKKKLYGWIGANIITIIVIIYSVFNFISSVNVELAKLNTQLFNLREEMNRLWTINTVH